MILAVAGRRVRADMSGCRSRSDIGYALLRVQGRDTIFLQMMRDEEDKKAVQCVAVAEVCATIDQADIERAWLRE
jgi:hypothetical protein